MSDLIDNVVTPALAAALPDGTGAAVATIENDKPTLLHG